MCEFGLHVQVCQRGTDAWVDTSVAVSIGFERNKVLFFIIG